jgi:two-component system, NtrC family, sensor kinase
VDGSGLEARRAQKLAAIGRLSGGIAHELNGPIGFVGSNLAALDTYVSGLLALIDAYEALESSADPDSLERVQAAKAAVDLDYVREDAPSLFKESEEGLARMKTLIQSLADFARNDGRLIDGANLNRVVDATRHIAHNEIKYKATVVTHYGEIPDALAVGSELQHALLELLVAAAHVVNEGSTLTIRTGATNARVTIEIDLAIRNADDAAQLAGGVASEIVESSGGRLDVTRCAGDITTVRMSLPNDAR